MVTFTLRIPAEKAARDCGIEPGGTVQKVIDLEVIRQSDPYTPFWSGALKNSAITHTVIGSGDVVYNCDNKARALYYGREGFKDPYEWNWSNGGVQVGGLRGPYWVQRAMENGGLEKVVEKAQKVVDGR